MNKVRFLAGIVLFIVTAIISYVATDPNNEVLEYLGVSLIVAVEILSFYLMMVGYEMEE